MAEKNSKAILKAVGISKSFEKNLIADQLDLAIFEGEIIAIMGKSGAGKSTLLKIMAGLEGYQHGVVEFEGKALEKVEDSLVPGHEELQYVAQDFRLLRNRTVLENIKEALLAFNESFTEQKINFLLDTLQLTHLQHKYIELLSGGEKQRLAIARAMASEPSILLLDEPFTQLDQINRQFLIDALLTIRETLSTSILMVTHQAEEVFLLADRVGVLADGSLIQMGTPQELYEQPVNQEVANLFGSINLLNKQLLEAALVSSISGALYGIRPENISINSRKQDGWLSAKVNKLIYLGKYSFIKLETDFDNSLFVFDRDFTVKVGDELFFSLDTDKLIKWPKA